MIRSASIATIYCLLRIVYCLLRALYCLLSITTLFSRPSYFLIVLLSYCPIVLFSPILLSSPLAVPMVLDHYKYPSSSW
jgi:hypothetical protein